MQTIKRFFLPTILLVSFMLYTKLITSFSVSDIGPEKSKVGFWMINKMVYRLFGENDFWLSVTNWTAVATILVAVGFAGFGLFQLISRKSLLRVDKSIYALGVFYLLLIACHFFFKSRAINYGPMLLDGELYTSYPVSHIVIVIPVMATATMQFQFRFINSAARVATEALPVFIIPVIVIACIFSGLHWFTDIWGSILLGAALATLYYAAVKQILIDESIAAGRWD